jgi:UDP-4-amino-4-deoxy-L-arabinose-oxoglutarate aminotransferase
MYKWLLQARSHGLSSNAAQRYTKKYEHYDQLFLGMKCNMSNIQAALLLHQLERIEELWQERKALWDFFQQHLSFVQKPAHEANTKHAYHLYTLWAQDQHSRDALLSSFFDAGVRTAVHYNPIHLMSYYKNKYGYKIGDYPQAERIGFSTITLPFYIGLTDQEREALVDHLKVNSIYGKFAKYS